MGIGPFRRITANSERESSTTKEASATGTADHFDEFVVLTNAPQEVLVYDPLQSYMISFGINEQHADNYKQKSLGDEIRLSTLDVTLSFIEHGVVAKDNYQLFLSSDEQQACSLEGMKAEINKQASKVGENGILVIFLSGHGVKYGPDKWGFVPGDYNKTAEAVLTGPDLTKSIQEAKCKSKYTLIILDCCYSGSMAMKLTSECEDDETCSLLSNTYVLAAGSANETSLAINSLGYTIFTYFLRFALDRVQCKPESGMRTLLLSDMFEECRLCVEALSSVVIRRDEEYGGLRFSKFRPSLTAFDPRVQVDDIGLEACDAATFDEESITGEGKTAFVWKYYQPREDKTQPMPVLHRITCDWLESLTTFQPSPLQTLEERNLLEGGYDTEGRILSAAITLLIHSIASIELVYNNDNVTDPNLLLLAFVEVMATLDRAHLNIKVTLHHLMEAALYYAEALKKSRVDPTEIIKLYMRVRKDTRSTELDGLEVRNSYMHSKNIPGLANILAAMTCTGSAITALQYNMIFV